MYNSLGYWSYVDDKVTLGVQFVGKIEPGKPASSPDRITGVHMAADAKD